MVVGGSIKLTSKLRNVFWLSGRAGNIQYFTGICRNVMRTGITEELQYKGKLRTNNWVCI